MLEAAALPPLIEKVLTDLPQVSFLWQLGVIAIALVVAWLANRFVAPGMKLEHAALALGAGGLRRALFPLSALVVVLVGRTILRKIYPVHLLDLAVSLLLALAIIRLAVYMLRHAFGGSGLVKRFEKLLSGTVWVGFALYVTGLAPDLLAVMEEIRLPLGKESISLLTIISGLLAVTVTLLVALWLGRMAEERLMSATEMDINMRVVLSKALQAGLILLAFMIALPAVGINLTALSVFGGALGVGLAFGLQKIASNYVSGFIILLDRSVSLGHIITVDNRQGQVTKMTARYLVVRSLDGTESIIPNETLITSTVVNHSHTEPRVRVAMPVQVSYETDIEQARRVVLDAVGGQSRVLKDPAPFVAITGLADSGVNLELNFFVGDPEQGTGVMRTEIYSRILQDLKAAGLPIPYPQREVRILGRSLDETG